MENRFTRLVGIKHPIQLAAMGGVATAELAGAVAAAGGLGMVTATADLQILGGGQRTHGVGIGFTVPFLDEDLVAVAAEQARVVEFFWAEPSARLIDQVHAGGALAAWQVGSAYEAQAAEQAGVDFVVVQGIEAGGHVRAVEPLRRTVPATRARVSIPIVAAGGIATRAQVRDALSIGADAVRIGTRFVATRESGAHPSYKAALVAARPGDSVLTDAFAVGWPDAPHRVLRHALKAASDRDPRTPVAHLELGQRRIPLPLWSVTPPSAAVTGDIDATAMYAGTAADTITDLPPAANVVADLAGAS